MLYHDTPQIYTIFDKLGLVQLSPSSLTSDAIFPTMSPGWTRSTLTVSILGVKVLDFR